MTRVLKTNGKILIITFGKKGVINVVNPHTLKPTKLENILTKEKTQINKLAWVKPYYILLIATKTRQAN